MTWVDRLVADLAEAGIRVRDAGTGSGVIDRAEGGVLDPPVPFLVDEKALVAYLESCDDGPILWPDVDSMTGAYRLLMINLEESFAIRPPRSIRITRRALKVNAAPPAPRDAGDGSR